MVSEISGYLDSTGEAQHIWGTMLVPQNARAAGPERSVVSAATGAPQDSEMRYDKMWNHVSLF